MPHQVDLLERTYAALSRLERGLGGSLQGSLAAGAYKWPKRGLYIYFEPGEQRHTRSTPRVVRIGTHAVSRGSKSDLWSRLSTHFGTNAGTGSHRSSIFRLHVGSALIAKSKGKLALPSWGATSATAADRARELALEKLTTAYIRSMSLLYLAIGDEPSPWSDRSYLERNLIATISGYNQSTDRASSRWLGRYSPHEAVRRSYLWNVNYVAEPPDTDFTEVLEHYVGVTLGEVADCGSIAPRGWYTGNKNQLFLF